MSWEAGGLRRDAGSSYSEECGEMKMNKAPSAPQLRLCGHMKKETGGRRQEAWGTKEEAGCRRTES